MTISIRSYAKINWTLDVLFKREDGFHEIRTLYQTVSLYDRLTINAGTSSIKISCSEPSVPCDQSNLVYKAAELLRDAAGIKAGARIDIEKRIPVAAGLGGGSSNAAAALLGLSRLWGLELDRELLIRLASEIGSDVPFFLFGGTAIGVGRGEEVYIIDDVTSDNILLVNPGIAVSTAAAYGALGRLTSDRATRKIPVTLLAANSGRAAWATGGNDLEPVVISIHREIGELKDRLMELGATQAMMSGSGATVFGVFDNLQMSERARDQFRSEGLWRQLVSAVGRNAYEAGLIEEA